ncbi:MAG TPA: protein-methionine-sulfoxide reductase heme-binding subunit MsrQ [Methylomirabilota bacterium]|nr:protein-methionine-sulfoxide reductase heme-binding subunit MsrQ [Methylomirabilota bacterium]
MTPWTDRAGRFSPLKAIVLVAAFGPALALSYALATGGAGPRPYDFAIHETGEWTIRFLLASLAVTPLRRIIQWPRLILVRRMLGLTALAYAIAHLSLYALDQNLDLGKIASEIVLRIYLLIGFVTLLGLAALGVTSTDAAIRRMGRNWSRLHAIVYGLAAMGLLHYFMQSKVDVSLPTIYAGVFLLLMLYRRAHASGLPLSPPVLAGVAVVAVAGTMALESAWYGLATGVPVERIFYANFNFAVMIRPSWWVGAIGMAVAALALVRGGFGGERPFSAGGRRGAAAG